MAYKSRVSDAVVRRLPMYYRHLRELEKAGVVVHDNARRPMIGDRICDTYNPFNGYIRKVSVKLPAFFLVF